jgi:hypothetical protein
MASSNKMFQLSFIDLWLVLVLLMVLVSAKKKLVIVNEQQQKIEEVLTESLVCSMLEKTTFCFM